MRIPGVKSLKSKLFSAKLLGNVAKNTLTFKLRRGAMRKRFGATDFETIIVDMDGTLFRSDANLEALIIAYPETLESGKTSGEELYDSIISKIASGEYSIEKGILEGVKFLMAKKMRKQDFYKVLDALKPLIRKPLVKALAEMKQNGKTVVLATLSSREFGEILNEYLKTKYNFSFDCIAGTEMNFDESGQITGLRSMVGTKDFDFEGIRVRSKLTAIKEALAEKGKSFDYKKAVIVTDSYGDIDITKSIVTILIKQPNPTTAQKVSYRLGLADYVLPDNKDLETNLASIILGGYGKDDSAEKDLGIKNA